MPILTDTKSFLLLFYNRRFVRAAQVCHEVLVSIQWLTVTVSSVCSSSLLNLFCLQGPALHLEFLANYVAELSLLEYSLLCNVPSLIAASSIFLAKFILKPAKNPWVCAFNLLDFYESSLQ